MTTQATFGKAPLGTAPPSPIFFKIFQFLLKILDVLFQVLLFSGFDEIRTRENSITNRPIAETLLDGKQFAWHRRSLPMDRTLIGWEHFLNNSISLSCGRYFII